MTTVYALFLRDGCSFVLENIYKSVLNFSINQVVNFNIKQVCRDDSSDGSLLMTLILLR